MYNTLNSFYIRTSGTTHTHIRYTYIHTYIHTYTEEKDLASMQEKQELMEHEIDLTNC